MTKEQLAELLPDLKELDDMVHDLSIDLEDIKFATNELKEALELLQEKFTEYLEKENNDNKN